MTPRTALFVAFVGVLLALFSAIPLFLIGDRDPANDDAALGIILLDLVGLLGLTILAVGLLMAAFTAFTQKRRKLS
jgi:hypothetical protein